MSDVSPSLRRQAGAEILGTFLLVFFGVGSVPGAVLHGALLASRRVEARAPPGRSAPEPAI